MFFYYLFLFLSPFQNNPRLGTVLFNLGFIPVTPIKLAGMAMVVAAILAAPPSHTANRRLSGITLLSAAFALVPLLETFALGRPIPELSISALISFAFLLFSTRRLISTPERIHRVIRVVVLAESFGSLWVYKQVFLHHWDRPNGPSSDPNYEALSLAMTLPLAIWLAIYDNDARWRKIGKRCGWLLAFAMLLLQSRGGMLALAVSLLPTLKHARHKLASVVSAAVGVAFLISLAPPEALNRITDVMLPGSEKEHLTGAEISQQVRLELFYAGLRMIRAHPVFGVGMDMFRSSVLNYTDKLGETGAKIAHNTYVQIGAECGLPVLTLFICLIFLGMKNCSRVEALAGSGNKFGALAAAMRLGLRAYCVGAFFLTAQYVRELWLFLFLSHCLYEVILSFSLQKVPLDETSNFSTERPIATKSIPTPATPAPGFS